MNNSLMTIFDNFNNKHNLIGFSDFFDDLDKFNNSFKEITFPPYSIFTKVVKKDGNDENHTFIQLACAGYTKDMLKITFNTKSNVLTVKGLKYKQDDNKNSENNEFNTDDGRIYYHKGIATREFENSWKMHESLEFVKSSLNNGILTIEFKDKKEKNEEIKLIDIE